MRKRLEINDQEIIRLYNEGKKYLWHRKANLE